VREREREREKEKERERGEEREREYFKLYYFTLLRMMRLRYIVLRIHMPFDIIKMYLHYY